MGRNNTATKDDARLIQRRDCTYLIKESRLLRVLKNLRPAEPEWTDRATQGLSRVALSLF